MVKKNDVIAILANGGSVMVDTIYRTATVLDADRNDLGRCRYDVAERLERCDGYTRRNTDWFATYFIEVIPEPEPAPVDDCNPYGLAACVESLQFEIDVLHYDAARIAAALLHSQEANGAFFNRTMWAAFDTLFPGFPVCAEVMREIWNNATDKNPWEREDHAARNIRAYAETILEERAQKESAAVEAATRAALDRAGVLAQEAPAAAEPEAPAQEPAQEPAPRIRYVRADYENGTDSAREALEWHRAGHDLHVCRHGRGAVLVHGAPQERPQERDENRETCRRIALDLEAHANGECFRCPDCGQEYRTPENLGDKFRCPNCGTVSDFGDLEFLGLYDYFSDFLDIDWILDSNREYKACRVMIACGGPNIYIDTYSGNVELYWWSDSASFPLLHEARAAVDDWAAEYWACCC